LKLEQKPHAHKKIHEFLINMAFTMACPNSKKGMKMASSPLGVNSW
jgi:serine protease inhibitor ecotin